MNELAALPDDQLIKMLQQPTAQPQQGGVQGMSNTDLMNALRKGAGLPAVQSWGDTAEDVAKSGGIGLAKGAIGIAGLAGDVGSLISRGVSAAGEKLGVSSERVQRFKEDYTPGAKSLLIPGLGPAIFGMAHGPTSQDIQGGIEKYSGKFYEPQTRAGRYAETVGEFLPSAAFGPGGVARRVAGTTISGLASEAAGEATKGTKFEPWARIGAAALAPAAAERLVTPVARANAAREQAVRTLRQEGVTDITAGQATGNKRLRYAESELGGSTAERMVERQQEQFTRAALRRVGSDAERATPDVIDQAFARIGGQMDRLAARNNVIADRAMINDIVAARDGYAQLVARPMQAPIVQNIIDRISNSFNAQGIMPGRTYQTIRSDIGRAARGTNDPQVRHTLYEIQGALDANVERVIRRNNSGDLGAWRDARRQYRNLLVIERASNYAGEAAASGLISPANLARATKAVQQSRNYARGRGDFTPLARAGVEVLSSLPNSGTAQRLRAHGIPAMIAAALGGTAGSAAGPHGTIGGIAAGLLAPRAAGEAILSAPGRAYLGNRLLPVDPHGIRSAAVRGAVAADQDKPKGLRVTIHPRSSYGGTQ